MLDLQLEGMAPAPLDHTEPLDICCEDTVRGKKKCKSKHTPKLM